MKILDLKVQTPKFYPKIKCTTFCEVYSILLNPKMLDNRSYRVKMQ